MNLFNVTRHQSLHTNKRMQPESQSDGKQRKKENTFARIASLLDIENDDVSLGPYRRGDYYCLYSHSVIVNAYIFSDPRVEIRDFTETLHTANTICITL